MNANLKNSLQTWLLPIVILLAFNYAYLYPALQGKILAQDDIMLGKAKGKEIKDYRKTHDDEPLWTNAMFSGMPTFQISTLYPNNWVSQLHKITVYIGGKGSSTYLIALLMIGMFVALRGLGVNHWLSTIGGFAYGYSAFFIISYAAGHNAKVLTAAYIPLVVLSVLLVLRNKVLLGAALSALFIGLIIRSNHMQITYYTLFLLGSIWVVYLIKAVKDKTLPQLGKQTAMLVIAGIIAIGPNIGNLWSTYAYTQETMRGGSSELTAKTESKGGLDFDYAMMWSYGILETGNLFIPNLMGGGAKVNYEGTDTYNFFVDAFSRQGVGKKKAEEYANAYTGRGMYWGDQSMVNGGYYIGAVFIFLFVFALISIKGPMRQWVVAALIIALIMAWGKNFAAVNKVFFDYLPLFNKFRVPSMALVVVLFLIPFMGMFGLQQFLKDAATNKAQVKKNLLLALYITGGFALVVALLGPSLFGMDGLNDDALKQNGYDLDMLMDDRGALMRGSAFRSLIFVGLAFGLMWFHISGRVKTSLLIGGIALFGVIDLIGYDWEQLNKDSFLTQRQYDANFAPTNADALILKDQDLFYRVFNTTVNPASDSYTSYYHHSVGGYHGAKLIRYQDLIENQMSTGNLAIFNMLNAKWFIVGDDQGNKQAQPNMTACGNAWFISEIKWAANADEEMAALSNSQGTIDKFNPLTTVIIDQRYKDYVGNYKPNPGTSSQVTLTSYDPKHMVYEAQVEGKQQLAVFSEIYYEGWDNDWKAYIDGEPVKHIRVNYLLRGLMIPGGKHTVEFKFEPKTYYVGEKINLAGSILLFGFVGIAGFMAWRRKDEESEAVDE